MLKVGTILKGYINCGTANPLYNKPVLLKVKTVINNELVEVTTVDEHLFKHHIDTFNKNHELVDSKVAYEFEQYTNWLKTDKPYEVVA